jgi:hypothetical protein
MKITKLEESFAPIQITIETAYEAKVLKDLFSLTITIPKLIKDNYDNDEFNEEDKLALSKLMSSIYKALQ